MDPQPWILVAGVLLIGGVVATKTSTRLGVPSLLLFIGLGMLAGSDGIGGIEFDDVDMARSFGVVALGFILFSGGLDTRFADIRPVLGQGIALASIGVALTATVVAGLASLALDLSVQEGVLLGAIVASTDAAAVFSILRSRGVPISPRLGATLELESGSNDPAAVFLTVAAIELITGESSGIAMIAGSFVMQMTLGAICGYVLARGATWLLNRLHLDFDGIYPVLTVGFVLVVLEAVTMIGGSGFLALYVAGVTMANRDYIHKRSLIRFHDGLAWLMQIAMFVLLGLLVFPARLPDVALQGLFVAVVLILVARPLAVFVTLLPFRVPVRQISFVSWVGLRGATPIILATFPLAAGVPNAERLFDVVFFVVLTSVLIQGTTIATAARRLRLVDGDAVSTRRVSFDTVITGDEGPRLHEVVVGPGSPAVDRQILDLDLPPGVLIVLVRRGTVSFMPQGNTVLAAGDEVLIAVEAEQSSSVADRFLAGQAD
ncbi:MAG: potassium/proton antiporter [Ilumatobacteraceae bacterium]